MHAALTDLGVVAFHRTFGPLERDQWEEMLQCVALHSPSMEEDSISWSLEPSGIFSIKSLYHALLATPGPTKMILLWEIKLPLKIHIFLWQWVRAIYPRVRKLESGIALGMGYAPYVAYLKTPTIFSFVARRQSSIGAASGR